MTAGVLKQEPNTLKDSKERLFILTQTTRCKFSGKYSSSGHKTTLKHQLKRLKTMKNDMRGEVAYLFAVVVFGACRKNVGMTMTCNRYDVMNTM